MIEVNEIAGFHAQSEFEFDIYGIQNHLPVPKLEFKSIRKTQSLTNTIQGNRSRF